MHPIRDRMRPARPALKGQKVGFVKRTHTGLAEPAINAERLAAETESLAETAREAAAEDHIAGADGSAAVVFEPAAHGKIPHRVKGDDIGGLSVD